MDDLVIVGRQAIEQALGPARARAAIGAALAAGERDAVARWSVPFGTGELLVMPADDGEIAGVKLITLPRGAPAHGHDGGGGAPGGGAPGVQGLYVLFDARSLTPLLLLDGPALTEARTAAVSAWVADRLAPPGPATLVLFGSGPQARAHLRALAAVRPLQQVLVVGRNEATVAELLDEARRLGVDASPSGATAVADAGIVCCCTSSPAPLFDGGLPAPGTLVIAIGSHRPDRREVDTATVLRSAVVVETRAVALAEAGDLLIPIEEGAWSAGRVAADLFELAHERATLPPERDLVLFKSVGTAFEDLAMARAVLRSAGLPGAQLPDEVPAPSTREATRSTHDTIAGTNPGSKGPGLA